MNSVDIVLAIILLYGLVKGFFRGFFAELASLIALVAGIYGAIHFSYLLSDILLEKVSWNTYFVNLAAFAITFFVIVFAVSLAGKFLTTVANFAALGIFNKIFGAVFGLITAAFVTSVVIMFFAATNEEINLVEEETLQASILYGPVKIIAPTFLPSILKEAEELDLIPEEEIEVEEQHQTEI